MQKFNIPGPGHQATHRAKAIGLIMVAVSLFTCLDGTAKYLVTIEQLPVTQVVWMRFLGQFFALVFAVGAISIPPLLRTGRLRHQIARSVLLLLSTVLNFVALRYLRLDQTTTILFLAPLTVALLAGPALGEWVGWRRLIAILAGFGGILIAIRPGFADFHPAVLLSLGCMVFYACFILLTRYLAAYDSSETTLLYSMMAGSYFMAPLAFVDWVWPVKPYVWLLLLSLGFWAAAGHWIFIVAHRLAPASTIAPFLYVQIVSVTAFGYLVFGDLPDAWTLAGSAVIIASGIYLLHRERVTAGQRSRGL